MPEPSGGDYPWIEVYPVTRASKADLGWTRAECQRCGRTSHDNAEPYTEEWTHEHARKCHPRWTVRQGPCERCTERARKLGKDTTRWSNVWVICDSTGRDVGCREQYEEAIASATRKAGIFLRNELTTLGVRF